MFTFKFLVYVTVALSLMFTFTFILWKVLQLQNWQKKITVSELQSFQMVCIEFSQ